ncbi:cache domain-containing protein [Herbaspirillum sp. ST 5-3]|uniref:cache domain-containing protein n=1 Tax=Oxalobacteraceae TaxID=75682 RepID=UPI0010A3249B|nr:cache domain-containing protein [Herbaspirillum sp. ST 5-3]
MKALIKLLFVFAAATFGINASAADRGTPEEAVAMVKKVIEYMKANGTEKAIAEVNNVQGQFRDRDLYVTINDLNAKTLAHGANVRMQGRNLIDLKDADGKFFMRERMELARTKGKGWQDYKFVNPETKQIESKSMYFERVGDLIVNCGVYKQ